MTAPAGQRRAAYGAYPQTVLHFEGGPQVDLRGPLSPDDRDALAELDLGRTFAVLTAENPGGSSPGELSPAEADRRERENIRRTLRFEEHLAFHGVPYRRVDGTSPDGSYRERCVAVALSREQAEALARERDQVALFWYDGERFWLWPAEVDASPRPLPAAHGAS